MTKMFLSIAGLSRLNRHCSSAVIANRPPARRTLISDRPICPRL